MGRGGVGVSEYGETLSPEPSGRARAEPVAWVGCSGAGDHGGLNRRTVKCICGVLEFSTFKSLAGTLLFSFFYQLKQICISSDTLSLISALSTRSLHHASESHQLAVKGHTFPSRVLSLLVVLLHLFAPQIGIFPLDFDE